LLIILWFFSTIGDGVKERPQNHNPRSAASFYTVIVTKLSVNDGLARAAIIVYHKLYFKSALQTSGLPRCSSHKSRRGFLGGITSSGRVRLVGVGERRSCGKNDY
jgi:hypothetical protein